MKFLGDVFSFERHKLKNMGRKVKDNPEQLLIGAGDPFSAKVWGKALGKEYEPLVDQWGGATKDDYQSAEAAGIDTDAGKDMHSLARIISAVFSGKYLAGKTGGAESGAGSAESGAMPGNGMSLGSVQPPQQELNYEDYRADENYSDPYIESLLRSGAVATSTRTAKRELGSARQVAVQRGIAQQNPVDSNGVQIAAIKSLARELAAAKQRLAALKSARTKGGS